MASCGCPENYLFNPETGLCESLVNGAVGIGTDPHPIPDICKEGDHMINGTAFYPVINPNQYPLIGSTSSNVAFTDALSNVVVPTANILSGNLWISGGSVSNGLMNQRGVGLVPNLGSWYGLNRCFTVGQGDVISVGLCAKSAYRLYVDGDLVLIHEPVLPAKANQNFHIFPLNLTVGDHTIRAEAKCNVSYTCNDNTQYGAFLVEVYRNVTPIILSGISSQGILNNYYAPTNGAVPALSAGSTGFDVSSNINTALFYCTNGWVNACTQGQFACTQLLTSPYVPCCFDLVECTTSQVIKTTTDLSSYIGHIIKIEEAEGCYIITNNTSQDCTGAIVVTVVTYFSTCFDCNLVYYKLTDCGGRDSIAADITTITDLSTYLGQVIKIEGYNDVCWIVSLGEVSPIETVVTVVTNFATCEDCNPPPPIPDPPFYQLTPLALKARSVQPGYDVGECSADFVEQVNCNFATQVYARLNEQKYGVESCIEDNYDKWLLKKQLLELNLIYNPDLCKPILCCAPECVTTELIIFNQVNPTAPINLSVDIDPGYTPALPPEDVNSTITY